MFFKNLIFLSLDHLSNQEKYAYFNIQEDEEIMVDNNEPTEKSTFDSFFESSFILPDDFVKKGKRVFPDSCPADRSSPMGAPRSALQ